MRVDEKRIRAWRHAFRIHWSHTEQHETAGPDLREVPVNLGFLESRKARRVTRARRQNDTPRNVPRKLTGFNADLRFRDIIIEHKA
jgi:hypothetical protein